MVAKEKGLDAVKVEGSDAENGTSLLSDGLDVNTALVEARRPRDRVGGWWSGAAPVEHAGEKQYT